MRLDKAEKKEDKRVTRKESGYRAWTHVKKRNQIQKLWQISGMVRFHSKHFNSRKEKQHILQLLLFSEEYAATARIPVRYFFFELWVFESVQIC